MFHVIGACKGTSLNVNSGTMGYDNKILVSYGNFSLGKNDKVNTFELAKISHKVVQQPPAATNYHSRNQLILTTRKNCLDNFYGRCFCNMEYVSVKASRP